jgi:oligopeptide transport system substrate-binding protein
MCVVALVAIACTNDPETPEAGPTATPTPEGSPTSLAPLPNGTPVEEEDVKEFFEEDSAILSVATSEPATLDPMRIQDPGSVLVARQLYEGLTRWDPVREEVVPGAARSWKVSDDGRTFTFQLRQDATFHDGTPVTSKDFQFAFNRIATKKNASDLAYALEPIEGFFQVNRLGRGKRLKGIETPNPNTLVIHLSDAFHDLPALLTHPGLVPLPRQSVKDIDSFLSAPVGNGPFKMTEPWSPGEPVALEAFSGYFKPVSLDGIAFIPVVDPARSWLAFDRGDVDVSEVPVGQFSYAANSYGESGVNPFLAGYYYGLNMKSGSLRNIKVREAINLAIDRAAISDRVYRGALEPPRGIVPRGMPGFDHDACADLCAHNPARARRLLKDVPTRKKRIQLDFTRGDPHARVARAVEDDLAAVGFKVETKGYSFGKYFGRLTEGKGEMYRLGWIAEYPVPDVFLSPLFGSGSPDNHSGFESRKVDALLDRAHAQPDLGRRLILYRRAEKAILRRIPIVPIGSFVTHWASRPGVEGIEFDTLGGFDAANISLSE